MLSLKSLEQDIVVAVDDAVGHVETNLKSVEAARAATRLPRNRSMRKRRNYWRALLRRFLVLQAQTQLATARARLRSARRRIT